MTTENIYEQNVAIITSKNVPCTARIVKEHAMFKLLESNDFCIRLILLTSLAHY